MKTEQYTYTVFDEKDNPQTEKFLSNYNLVKCLVSTQQLSELLPKEQRICRFCNRKMPETSFNNQAHIIPHQLGSENLVSDFECDSCNKIFSKYESQLANFLGPFRTISKIKGKKGIPQFPSVGNEIIAKVENYYNIADAINITTTKGIRINPETGLHEIDYVKPPYKPLQVFKALVRIGFCMLENSEIKHYKKFIADVLIGNKFDKDFKNFAGFQLYSSELPVTYKNTTCLLFKCNFNLAMPTYEFVIFSKNKMFQIVLPYHEEEFPKYANFTRLRLPPGHFTDLDISSEIKTTIVDLSDINPIKESGVITFKLDPLNLKDITAIDLNTGNISENKLESSDIRKIVFANLDQNLILPNKKDDKIGE